MIKAVVFDVGKVVLDESGTRARAVLAESFKFSEEEFGKYARENLKMSYIGDLSAEDFFGGLKEELNIEGSVEDMIEAWKDARRKTSCFDESVLDVIKKLKGNYLLASLSDTTALNDIVRKELGVYDLFDVNVTSVDAGAKKPEEKIYDALLKRLEGILPNEIVFVDDKIENLEVAMEKGIHTILFEGVESLEMRLIELGVEV